MEHGLARAGRYVRLVATVPDRPGRLAAVLRTVGEQGANVLQVEHHRRAPELPVGAVEVSMLLEVRDTSHSDSIAAALADAGYRCTPAAAGQVRVTLEGLVGRGDRA